MNIALVTDAWTPQANSVVTTLVELVRELARGGHRVEVIHPRLFRTRPCPGDAGIELAVSPWRGLSQQLDGMQPDAIHIATEGPLGWAARRYCLRRSLAFTTAFHTKFPELLNAAAQVPQSWVYALLRHFHRPSSGVMVPTQGVLLMLQQRGFSKLRAWTHGVDTRLFAFHGQSRPCPQLGALAHPVWLHVGRVSHEKNIDAFLALDLPGTKVVCGAGPLQVGLRQRFPQVRWPGLLSQSALAQVYAAADVFVFPGRVETFGLAMLEAMSCGAPVAAYPVDGPLQVLGTAKGAVRGGVLHDDLKEACVQALAVPRHEARAQALTFSWSESAAQFLAHLVPTDVSGASGKVSVTRLS